MIKAIIFDFGRVISAQKSMSLFHQYERDLNLPPGKLNRVMFGSDGWDEVLTGRQSIHDYWRKIGPQLNLPTDEAITAFRRRYRSDEAREEGVFELMQALRGRYQLAVLSNAPNDLNDWLAKWEILPLLDVLVVSAVVGIAKPDPAIYQLTLERLKVAPAEAVFIDDSWKNVSGAEAVGMHAIHFSTVEALRSDLKALHIEWAN
jgi:putative hydrolase of the HAD superfamily